MNDYDKLTDAELVTAKVDMLRAGRARGKAAASWLLDGNSTREDAAELLRQCEECELDIPSPLSGEWADDPTLTEIIDNNTEWQGESLTNEERDELATAFEDGYYAAFAKYAELEARRMLAD